MGAAGSTHSRTPDRGALALPALALAALGVLLTKSTPRRWRWPARAGRVDFVLGSREELRPVWKGFAIQPQEVRQEHQARFTLVDKRGFQRVGFPGSQATPARLAHDLRILERE